MAITITAIPAPYRAGFAKIKSLSPQAFEEILSALEKVPITGGLKQLASSVIAQVPSLKREELEDILRSLFSLSIFVADEDTPLSENLSSLSRAMMSSSNKDLRLSEEEKEIFEDRLQKLLNTRSVVISSKVQRLRLEYPITFHDAVIVTDMRPVFENVEEHPLGCAILHTLRIGYHENAQHKEFFIALDDDDLEALKKVIDRAKSKAGSIKSLLKLANLPDLS